MDVFASIERIIADEFKSVDIDVFAPHGEVITASEDVFELDVFAVPERFFGV